MISTAVITINALRACVDESDRRALEAINRRASLVQALVRRKRNEVLPLRDEARELQIKAGVVDANHGPLPDAAILRIWNVIMEECRKAAGI